MRRTALVALALTLAACGDSTGPDLGSLAGYWEGTSGDSVSVEVVLVGGETLAGCASFRFPWMGEDSRETIDILGSTAGDVVTLHEAPAFSAWDFQGERSGQDAISGTSSPEHHLPLDVTLVRRSTGGTCGTRALP